MAEATSARVDGLRTNDVADVVGARTLDADEVDARGDALLASPAERPMLDTSILIAQTAALRGQRVLDVVQTMSTDCARSALEG